MRIREQEEEKEGEVIIVICNIETVSRTPFIEIFSLATLSSSYSEKQGWADLTISDRAGLGPGTTPPKKKSSGRVRVWHAKTKIFIEGVNLLR